MNHNQYQLAGWLSIIGAVILIPLVVLSVLIEKLISDPFLKMSLLGTKTFFNMLISIYVYTMLKKLLNERYNFHKVDNIILIYIGLSILSGILGLIGLIPGWEIIIGLFSMALLIPLGLLGILLGAWILKLDDDLFGLLKPFAYLNITAGILAMTIILSPLGLLAAIAALFFQGMIFLRAKEQVEFV